MQISYDGIIFDIVLLKNWLKEAVYTEDKTTFLYWHHVIEVEATLNDDATNYENFPLLGADNNAQNPAVLRNKARLADAQRKAAWIVRKANRDINKIQRDFVLGPQPRTDLDFIPKLNYLEFINPANLESIPVPGGDNVGAPGLLAKIAELKVRNNANDKLAQVNLDLEKNKEDPFNLTVKDLRHKTIPQSQRKKHTLPSTDVELRNRLSRPRRQLAVWLFTGEKLKPEYLLVSPDPSTVRLDDEGNPDTGTIDALTGPLCTVLNTTAIHGQQTAVMSLKFETWEGPKIVKKDGKFATLRGPFVDKDGKPLDEEAREAALDVQNRGLWLGTPAILSHRWEMSYGFNPQNYLRIRVIEGEVIFRSDVLKLRGISADQLRTEFMRHRVPPNYIRRPVEDLVRLSSNGVGIKYRIVDDEQMTNFPAGDTLQMVSIDASSTIVYKSGMTMDAGSSAKGSPTEDLPKPLFPRRHGVEIPGT